jgi:hypothetical protein
MESGRVRAELGGHMTTTRRQALGAAWFVLSATLAAALPNQKGALEVTFYYLPG